jgi:hypothetical protein
MIRIEYQLTFEEFREGMAAVRGRALRRIKKRSRRTQFFLFLGTFVGLLIGLEFAWKLALGPAPRPAAPLLGFRETIESVKPQVFTLVTICALVFMAVYLARRQFRNQVDDLWNETPRLHQLRAVTFDEHAVTVSDPLAESLTRWEAYLRVDETRGLFLLYTSEFAAEMFPKRAFADPAQADALRELASRRLAERAKGFEVLPSSPPSPTAAP